MTSTLASTPTARPAEDPRTPAPIRAARPRWERPALAGLLVATAVLYLWDLGASGWANAFYSAAVQAGTQSWKAFFFGSFDASNAITVDKPPASLWVMELAARIFGVNSWSILVPQALEGVAVVGLLYATVRRRFEAPAALLAGAVMALTPVAVLMFRFDNPDALLVLLLVGAAYALVRALEVASTRWLLLVGALVGFAFLAKMMQAFLVVPGFALAYLLLGPPRLRTRLLHLLGAGAALVVGGGWWVAIVQLWPASSRPYIGGSTDNSVLQLALGYNGLSRLDGSEAGPQSGTPGVLRLFGTELAGQIAWLLPAALIALVAGLVFTARAPRTDRVRAGLAVWGGWLVVTAAVFSLMAGTFHSYYTVALAPAVAALVGIGVGIAWPRRAEVPVAAVLAGTVLLTTGWSFALLTRTADFAPALRWAVLVAGLVASVGLAVSGELGRGLRRTVAALGVVAALAGPAAYSLETAATAHTGSMPTSGPASAGNGGGFRGGVAGGMGGGLRGGFGGGTPPSGTTAGSLPTGGAQGTGFGGGSSSDLIALLEKDAGSYTWVAATTGSQTAATYQLATQHAVMAIGGFTGSDDSPTLAQFQADVAAGKIHYYLAGGGMGGGRGGEGGSGAASQIASWVAANFSASTIGGVTVYDLTS